MSEAIETLEGWYALHDFRTVDWSYWNQLDAEHKRSVQQSLNRFMEDWRSVDPEHGSSGLYQIIGHKADLLFLHFRSQPEELAAIEHALDASLAGRLLTRPYSYFSVVELSKYLARGDADPNTNPYLKSRLQPQLPNARGICFYPMNKRRQGHDNWYMVSKDERRDMMKNHGMIGHKYHDQVLQVITGSQGLDDWEWGVTLFADDLISIKKLIYEMRFDEASARFADFGPFYLGFRLDASSLDRWLSDPE